MNSRKRIMTPVVALFQLEKKNGNIFKIRWRSQGFRVELLMMLALTVQLFVKQLI